MNEIRKGKSIKKNLQGMGMFLASVCSGIIDPTSNIGGKILGNTRTTKETLRHWYNLNKYRMYGFYL
jgi:hypothetical protein